MTRRRRSALRRSLKVIRGKRYARPVIPANADVEAELAIRHLAASYTDAANRLSPEDAAEVWAPDGVLAIMGREFAGKENIFEGYRRTFIKMRLIFQMNHSSLVSIDGDRAHCRWWVTELSQRLGGDEYRLSYGVYQDEVVRISVGWRYARRQFDSIRGGPIEFHPAEPGAVPTWIDLA